MDRLKEYRSKRDFGRTPEPAGGAEQAGAAAGAPALFVVHKHAAQRLHYDLRLEQDGVLRSWALPKGPSLEPGERRLAVEVEDHPLEYAEFEGVIPRKQYGGGTVMLWDVGVWRRVGTQHRDRLDLLLEGRKLRGSWTLTRMKDGGEDGRNWLMIRRRDGASGDAPDELDDVSVLTGRSLDEIALDADRVWTSSGDRARVPRPPALQLARIARRPPAGDDWLHEIKFDGYRIAASVAGGAVQLYSRNGHDWTGRFPRIARALARLDEVAVLDGEVVAFRRDGVSSFGDLQEAIAAERTGTLVYQVFDLLQRGDRDLRELPLVERKAELARVVQGLDEGAARAVRFTDHVEGKGGAFFDRACAMGLEGVVSKRRSAPYRGERSGSWLKVKCSRSDEFVVGGFTPPRGSRGGFGALLLGTFEGDALRYAGRVGTGFSERAIRSLLERLQRLERPTPPFYDAVPSASGATWVEPRLVVDVAFTERTRDGRLRHPSYRGVRDDKEAVEVRSADGSSGGGGARGDAAGGAGRARSEAPARGRARRARGGEAEVAGVRLSNPDRVLYREQGVTKLELARYYERVAEHLLPWVGERPLSLVRCPQGRERACFFQKHPGDSISASVPRVDVRESSGTRPYVYLRTVEDLVSLVQVGVLELHVWGSRVADLERPDILVFDLDPDERVEWSYTRATALALRSRLDDLGLASFVRTTGGKGLHLVVPIVPRASWEEAKEFARAVSEAHARSDPERLTTTISKAKRRGKVLIDYLRNGRGATAIASYSTRARAGAPVAVPLRWDELRGDLRSDRYDVRTLPRRLAALRREPWQGFLEAAKPLDQATLSAAADAAGRRRRS